MQIVYLSARPGVFGGTLKQVERFMPFVDEAIVVCPRQISRDFEGTTAIPLTIVTDDELPGPAGRLGQDHQARNFSLRAGLVKTGLVDEEFIMADDDARPMRPIDAAVFVKDRRHVAYYFYDLTRWTSRKTSFDHGQHRTARLLVENGYPTLSYASHMPQIIDRDCYRKCLDRFGDIARDSPNLDEWSLYFNFALTEYPDRFHPPRAYLTFCWPDAPLTWPKYTEPDDLLFENYYPALYDRYGVFAGLSAAPSTDMADQVAAEKLARWNNIETCRRTGRLPMTDPWVGGSRLRWAAALIAQPLLRRHFRHRRTTAAT